MSKITRSFKLARNYSSLVVPYTQLGVANFEKGVPSEKVRELSLAEKEWDFWTSSSSTDPQKPIIGYLTSVPYGEVWVMERFGKYSKTLNSGLHFLIPMLDKVKAVKSVFPVAKGIIAKTTSGGNDVVVYTVAHLSVVNPVTSALYTEGNKKDSEDCMAKEIQNILSSEFKNIKLTNGEVSSTEIEAVKSKIVETLKAKESKTGVKLEALEFRGVFSSAEDVPDKLRSLSPPLVAPNTPGHGLSNDYWADYVLSPPYFEKFVFGSDKEARTPAAISLEWSIPSPPDYHHFNMVPKMTAEIPTEGKKAVKASH